MNTSEECAGMARRRRSPRLHPQIQASEEAAGVTARRHSPRLHPQIHAGEIGAGMTQRRIRRRRGTSPAGPCCMPEDDDMLREILIRLPPEPSSLPRASAVCKHWLGLVTDPKFHRQFYAHHRKPPLLGVFSWTWEPGIVFNPVLDPPDRIPHVRFSLARHRCNYVLDCRHGLVLVVGDGRRKKTVVVYDPITGERRRLAIPRELNGSFFRGAVLSAAGNQGHVHRGCHPSPFKVVLISMDRNKPLASVYSSDTGGWLSTAAPHQLSGCVGRTSTLVGNTLYWLFGRDQILVFDLDGQGLSVIMGPPVVTNVYRHGKRQIVQAENGAVGFAILSYPHFQMWVRNVNGHGLATWVLWKTIEMDSILGLPPRVEGEMGGEETIQGYEEDTDVIFLKVNGSVYMVELKSMQSKKLDGTFTGRCHPFRSFYTPGERMAAAVLPGSATLRQCDLKCYLKKYSSCRSPA